MHTRTHQFKYKPADADWSREMRGNTLISAISLRNYMVLFTSRDYEKAQDFVQTLRRVGPPMGINIGDARMLQCQDDRTDTILRTIKNNLDDHVQMVGTIT